MKPHGTTVPTCISYQIEMFSAYAYGRLCQNIDDPSPTCVGSDQAGVFASIDEEDIRGRCAADARCEGYSRLSDPLRFHLLKTWKNYARVLRGNWTTFRKLDLCAVPSQAHADTRHAQRLVAEMRTWADEAWHKLAPMTSAKLFMARHAQLSSFAGSELAPAAGAPVFYPFSGADIMTATALFPAAPHYVMLAALPFGDVDCFLSAPCRAQAVRTSMSFLTIWRTHYFAWTESSSMADLFRDVIGPTTNRSIGVLPALLLQLRALGHELTGIERSSSGEYVSLRTNRSRISFVSRKLGMHDSAHTPAAEVGWLNSLLGRHAQPRSYATFLKAADAPVVQDIIRAPVFTQWLLGASAAIVADETGLPPSSFGRDEWSVAGLGNFVTLDSAYRAANIFRWYDSVAVCNESELRTRAVGLRVRSISTTYEGCRDRNERTRLTRTELARCFRGAELPFAFGYGDGKGSVGRGLLMAAMRRTRGSLPRPNDLLVEMPPSCSD